MNRTYEDMSKQELVTLVKRLTKQHNEWRDKAEQLREAIADVATNMEAADASYMGGFIEDLWKVIE